MQLKQTRTKQILIVAEQREQRGVKGEGLLTQRGSSDNYRKSFDLYESKNPHNIHYS